MSGFKRRKDNSNSINGKRSSRQVRSGYKNFMRMNRSKDRKLAFKPEIGNKIRQKKKKKAPKVSRFNYELLELNPIKRRDRAKISIVDKIASIASKSGKSWNDLDKESSRREIRKKIFFEYEKNKPVKTPRGDTRAIKKLKIVEKNPETRDLSPLNLKLTLNNEDKFAKDKSSEVNRSKVMDSLKKESSYSKRSVSSKSKMEPVLKEKSNQKLKVSEEMSDVSEFNSQKGTKKFPTRRDMKIRSYNDQSKSNLKSSDPIQEESDDSFSGISHSSGLDFQNKFIKVRNKKPSMIIQPGNFAKIKANNNEEVVFIGKKLTRFPHIGYPNKLIVLNLSDNNLGLSSFRLLEETNDSFVNLKSLNLSRNKFDILGKSFFRFFLNIEKFDISFNFLEEVSYGFILLKKLRRLKIQGNHIEMLPSILRFIIKLKHIVFDWSTYTELFGDNTVLSESESSKNISKNLVVNYTKVIGRTASRYSGTRITEIPRRSTKTTLKTPTRNWT